MGCTNVGRGGGRGLNDHPAAHGWGQKSIQTNTSSTRSEKNATVSSDTCVQQVVGMDEPNMDVSQRRRGSNMSYDKNAATNATSRGWGQKSIQTNTSSTCSKKNATMSSDTCVQQAVGMDEPNTDVSQRRRGSNMFSDTNAAARGTHYEKNATMSSDTRVQEPVGMDEPNTDVPQRRRGSKIIEHVPHDPSKRTMISLDGGEYA